MGKKKDNIINIIETAENRETNIHDKLVSYLDDDADKSIARLIKAIESGDFTTDDLAHFLLGASILPTLMATIANLERTLEIRENEIIDLKRAVKKAKKEYVSHPLPKFT